MKRASAARRAAGDYLADEFSDLEDPCTDVLFAFLAGARWMLEQAGEELTDEAEKRLRQLFVNEEI